MSKQKIVRVPSEESARRRAGRRCIPFPKTLGGPDELPVRTVAQRHKTLNQRLRVAIYSHDTIGLGHMRRNLLIAQVLASSKLQPVILMVAGADRLSAFTMPPGVDCMTLPALYKNVDGQYRSRRLDISLNDLIAIREKTIRVALEEFNPDVLIVDNVPCGALGELQTTLKYLRDYLRDGGRATRCVLGLRDVLDEPITVNREWRLAANEELIRKYYDAVWVYGDPTVYDLTREYKFSPDVAEKVRFTGYLDQRMRLELVDRESADPLANLGLPPGQLALCLLGGGQDGTRLAEAFAQAILPPETNGVIVTGPFMREDIRRRLRSRAAAQPRQRVLEFVTEPAQLLGRADRVIAMGGYNTICEVLSFEKRALIVPRVRPRREQLIRAERLRDLGLLDVLHPDDLSPGALTEWLAREMGPLRGVRDRIDLGGLARLPSLLEEVLAAPASFTWEQPSDGRIKEREIKNVAR